MKKLIGFVILFSLFSAGFAQSYVMPYPYFVSCKTYSMYPTLWCKDRPFGVIPSFEEKQNLSIGSIVAYDLRAFDHYGTFIFNISKIYDYSFAIHRIVGKENGTYILKGDNNGFPDEVPVKPAQIIFIFLYSKPNFYTN